MKRVSVFWGCTIPARFPFIEKATRLALGDVGAELVELDGFTCCPESTLVKGADEEVYYLAAARNLAVAEEAGLELVTPCSGCYSTLKSTTAELRSDWRRRDRLNIALSAVGRTYDAAPPVRHLAEWLYDEVGPAALAKRVLTPLAGMRLAVHYGCHLLRPSPALRWDSSTDPSKLEDMVAALGAAVVEHETKLECCGGALDRVGRREDALALCARKLEDLDAHRVDGLVVACPSCFQQFDLNQAALLKKKRGSGLPVFYYSELFALTTGREAGELGLSQHRVPVEPFLTRWQEQAERRREAARYFSLSELQACAGCRACEDDCPVARVDRDFSPAAIVTRVLAGELETVLDSGLPWRCLECYTCYERCHSRLGMAEFFRRLKSLALEMAEAPGSVTAAWQLFLESGSLGEPRETARSRLGLSPLPSPGGEELRALLSAAGRGRAAGPASVEPGRGS
jgi:heterodisulfide reductase subunit B